MESNIVSDLLYTVFGGTVYGVTRKKTRLKIAQKCQVETKEMTTTKAH